MKIKLEKEEKRENLLHDTMREETSKYIIELIFSSFTARQRAYS